MSRSQKIGVQETFEVPLGTPVIECPKCGAPVVKVTVKLDGQTRHRLLDYLVPVWRRQFEWQDSDFDKRAASHRCDIRKVVEREGE